MSNDYAFVTKSCVESKETIKWEDGNEYPVVKLEISQTENLHLQLMLYITFWEEISKI